MKFFVAFLLVLTTFSSGAVTQGQTTPRRAKQSAVSKPRSETVRICQGVPIPEGYVVIAYMTSAVCPHGAYLLKKQNDYESSLAVNGSARQPAEESAEPPKTPPAKPSRSTAQPRGPSTQSARRPPAAGKSREPQTCSAQPTVDSASTAGASSSTTRPGRVGALSQDTSQSQEGPPSLIGSQPATALGPPTLANSGTKPDDSLAGASSPVVSAAGPEKVSEGAGWRVNTSLEPVPFIFLNRHGRFLAALKLD